MSHILFYFDIQYTVTQRQYQCVSFIRNVLEDDLVFEAAVQVFMWENDGVEYNDLGGDAHITTCGDKARLELVPVQHSPHNI